MHNHNTSLIAWFLEMCLLFEVIEWRVFGKPISSYETLANCLLQLLLAMILPCNCSILHVVLPVASVIQYCINLCVDEPRTTQSFEDSCVFPRVCTLLSLQWKVLKKKLSLWEHVQGTNKRAQKYHYSVCYILHLNEEILFSVTLVSTSASVLKTILFWDTLLSELYLL